MVKVYRQGVFRKVILASLFIILFLAMFTASVKADGGMYIQQEGDKAWRLFNEGTQLCAINYKNGYENMILTIDTREELTGSQAVWIFPIPASPEKTVININKGFPSLPGRDLDKSYDDYLAEAMMLISASQIYPLPLILSDITGNAKMGTSGMLDAESSLRNGVLVYEHIEKYGLTTELVSISSASALDNYLSRKGLVLDNDFIATFGTYVGRDNSLVISWISNVSQYKLEQANVPREDYFLYGRGGAILGNILGVSITFPTNRMYFPLKPTSIYGSMSVPAAIYVMGQVQPELYPEIKPYTKVTQYYASSYRVPDNSKDFFFNEDVIDGLVYTKIEIDAPAKYYTSDLWINSVSKPSTSFKVFALNHRFLFILLLLIVLSILASIISAAIVFVDDNPELWKFGLFGMSNFLTLIGFSALAKGFSIDEKFTRIKKGAIITADYKKVFASTIKLISIIVGALFVLMLILGGLVSGGFRYMSFDWELLLIPLLPFILVSAVLFLLLKPFVWCYYNNRKLMKYLIGFTVIFLVLSILTWIVLAVM